MKFIIPVVLICCFACNTPQSTQFDFAINNAQVIDPETNTNQVLHIGISGNIITKISKTPLVGTVEIDGTGLILSPGFIDLHAHGQTNKENYYQLFDGVTTALELEVGVDTLTEWISARKDSALINYGASACYLAFRNQLIRDDFSPLPSIFLEVADSAAFQELPTNTFFQLESLINKAFQEGAIGIGIPVGYLSNASVEEVSLLYKIAAEKGVPVFTHIREGGAIAVQQALYDAIIHGTELHICHIHSMARKDIMFSLQQIHLARKQGYPITTEIYPYTAGNTEISSAIFDEGWQERLGCSHHDLQWVESGERLTKENFDEKRKEGGSVIVHMLEQEWVDSAVVQDFTMIASDGGGYSPKGHPRGSGSFTKTIRDYVLSRKLLSMKDVIAKMTIKPALLLEKSVPSMKKRGRIQEGCFADILLFDPNKIQDNANYENGFVEASGMQYVFINGKQVIHKEELVNGVYAGEAILSKYD